MFVQIIHFFSFLNSQKYLKLGIYWKNVYEEKGLFSEDIEKSAILKWKIKESVRHGDTSPLFRGP